MRVLVTGGTGFVGGSVVRALASRGHVPVVFSRSACAAGLPGQAIDGDVRDRAAVARAMEGCDAVIHMAALVTQWRPTASDFDAVNVDGLRHVIEAARHARVERVVYTSSFLALPPPGSTAPLAANDYQRTKARGEVIAAEAAAEGLPLMRVYPGVVFGPGSMTEGNLVGKMVGDHLAGRLPGLVGPEHVWSYSYAPDLAEGYCLALERGVAGARYILGGENRTQYELFEAVRALTGRRPPRRIPFTVARALGAIEEGRARLFGSHPLITRGAVDILAHDWPLDSSVSVREIGYRMTPFTTGLATTLASLGYAQPAVQGGTL